MRQNEAKGEPVARTAEAREVAARLVDGAHQLLQPLPVVLGPEELAAGDSQAVGERAAGRAMLISKR